MVFFFFFQIYHADHQYIETVDHLTISRSYFKLQLQSSNFVGPGATQQGGSSSSSNNNGLTLRCTARMDNLYQENTEIELGVPQKDPVPARGKHFKTFIFNH